MKPIHKAICAGVLGATLGFGFGSFAYASRSSVREHSGMIFIVCGPHAEDVRPWYWAFVGYAITFTPVLIATSVRARSDSFRRTALT